MPQQGDYLLGSIALREGFITREQLFDCLQAQERNPARSLGAVLVQRGYLRKEDVSRLLEMQKHAMEQPAEGQVSQKNTLFGKLLIDKGLATEYQVNECLRLQGRLADMGLKPVPMLGEILIRRGYLKPDAVATALQMQNLSLYVCPECGTAIDVPGDPGAAAQYLCRACGIEVPFLFAKMAAAVQEALDKAAAELDFELPEEIRTASREPKNHFGKYIFVREIGRGGTGIVYKAWQRDLNKIVALKLLPHESDTASGVKTPYGDAEDVKRFYNETRAAADLQNDNIVPILDFGLVDNHFFYTMKFIEGTTLDEIIRDGGPGNAFQTTLLTPEEFHHRRVAPDVRGRGMPVRDAMRLILPLVQAAAYAHERGIFHRDIKPGNIIVDKDGRPWLMDFGLAKVARIGDSAYVKGVIMGTPYYMPPEQAEGDMEQVDHLSDIYSLGGVLYEMVSGRCPFAGKSADEVLETIASTPPDPIRQIVPDLTEDAARIIERAMQSRKADRYPNAAAVAEDIRRFLAGEPLQEASSKPRAGGLLQKVKRFFKKK